MVVLKNSYSNCPLKKLPLSACYEETEQTEPEDLTVKCERQSPSSDAPRNSDVFPHHGPPPSRPHVIARPRPLRCHGSSSTKRLPNVQRPQARQYQLSRTCHQRVMHPLSATVQVEASTTTATVPSILGPNLACLDRFSPDLQQRRLHQEDTTRRVVHRSQSPTSINAHSSAPNTVSSPVPQPPPPFWPGSAICPPRPDILGRVPPQHPDTFVNIGLSVPSPVMPHQQTVVNSSSTFTSHGTNSAVVTPHRPWLAENPNKSKMMPDLVMPVMPARPKPLLATSPGLWPAMVPLPWTFPSILCAQRSSSPPSRTVDRECLSPGSDSATSSDGCSGGSRGEARYSCSDCGKSYSTYSGLSKHKQFHCAALGAKSFACKHCHKVYTSLGALKMHIRTHTLPCKCHLCGKAFSRPWLLQGHIRTHTGEKPFNCTQCDRSFADRSNLRAHLQTHADIKKYACNTCHKTFSRMSLLNKHMEAACPALHRH
ncbi:unnamed protein product [Meganyctiphanes norvegica]|uniref:C2H2-type domain-containing protein n=1 Tax=Meganyctiphanes norvegica TaxID=48144 RepID=A0AAV2QTW8_MEGNR